MAKILSNSVVRQIFYRIGKDPTSGEILYRRAPFDMVLISGVLHIKPWSGGFTDQSLRNLALDSQEDRDMWRQDIGYELMNPVILNENEMGDGRDNWIGLHAISNI